MALDVSDSSKPVAERDFELDFSFRVGSNWSGRSFLLDVVDR